MDDLSLESPGQSKDRAKLWTWLALLALLACAVAGSLASGCLDDRSKSTARNETDLIDRQMNDEVFQYAIGLLNGLDEFDSSATLSEVVDRLNQWSSAQPPPAAWKRDPLVDRLPAELRKTDEIKGLADLAFPPTDGAHLRQAFWLREVAADACGDTTSDLERGELLFDWTVRNIQLEPDDGGEAADKPPPHAPWQTLVLGRGTAVERAWLFAMLARQQSMDVVVLALPQKDGEPKPWLPALLVENELYLFDARLGLPIPGPGGVGVATLSQVAADDGLLRHLDLSRKAPYGVTAADASGVVALIESTPMYLSRRMELVESRLAGQQRLVLTVAPSQLAERLSACPQVREVELWRLPIERQRQTSDPQAIAAAVAEMRQFKVPFYDAKKGEVLALWKGRILHLMGQFGGEDGANHYYQLARLAESDIQQQMQDMTATLEKSGHVFDSDGFANMIRMAKQDAGYWLGLAAFERGNYPIAVDYFQKRTIEAFPDGHWISGAQYNLGRAWEASGDLDRAIAAYESGAATSPQRHGDRLRARWLRKKSPAAAGEAKAPKS